MTILAASVGLLSLCVFFGGISFGQVVNLFAVTAASGVAGGALGLLIALWRDRTFQSISLTILMVVFSVAGVEAFAIAFPDARVHGSAAGRGAQSLSCDAGGALSPRPMQLTGVVRASSLVYIGCRLTFAAALVAFGTWKLRKWNPGSNEPRELREEGEVEVVETLDRSRRRTGAEPVVAVGHRRRAGPARRHRRRQAVRWAAWRSAHCRGLVGCAGERQPDEPGPTTGLHVPRRTHRRIAAAARPYRHPWANPILWRELMTRAYGAKPLIIKGCYVLLFALGHGPVLSTWARSSKTRSGRRSA